MGWNITPEHMTETPPRWIEPLRYTHGAHELVGLAPPQAQGVFCAIVLGITRHLGLAGVEPGSAEHLFFMGHALRYAAAHWGFIGDTQVVGDYPIDVLLDDGFHATAARLIRGLVPRVDLREHIRLTAGQGGAGRGRPTGASAEPELPPGSCELAIVDRYGNWVQLMNTLQSGGIPGMVVDGIPMVGSHAAFANLSSPQEVKLVPGARMRRALGNTFILADGRPSVSLGSPGNVYCTVPQVISYLLDFGYDPYAAADAPRMLPMAEDSSLVIEDRVSPAAIDRLARLGVQVRAADTYDYHMGSYQMCFPRTPGTDRRGRGPASLRRRRRRARRRLMPRSPGDSRMDEFDAHFADVEAHFADFRAAAMDRSGRRSTSPPRRTGRGSPSPPRSVAAMRRGPDRWSRCSTCRATPPPRAAQLGQQRPQAALLPERGQARAAQRSAGDGHPPARDPGLRLGPLYRCAAARRGDRGLCLVRRRAGDTGADRRPRRRHGGHARVGHAQGGHDRAARPGSPRSRMRCRRTCGAACAAGSWGRRR